LLAPTDHDEARAGEKPEHIYLQYHWHGILIQPGEGGKAFSVTLITLAVLVVVVVVVFSEEVVADSVSGISFILLTSTLVAWLCVTLVACGWDSHSTRSGSGAAPAKRAQS
jgi:hypothetical protein